MRLPRWHVRNEAGEAKHGDCLSMRELATLFLLPSILCDTLLVPGGPLVPTRQAVVR